MFEPIQHPVLTLIPYGAINKARSMAIEFIRNNCKKLRERGLTSEEMPKDWIPSF